MRTRAPAVLDALKPHTDLALPRLYVVTWLFSAIANSSAAQRKDRTFKDRFSELHLVALRFRWLANLELPLVQFVKPKVNHGIGPPRRGVSNSYLQHGKGGAIPGPVFHGLKHDRLQGIP